jgi:nucleotide-binding universal stress UspA family protein
MASPPLTPQTCPVMYAEASAARTGHHAGDLLGADVEPAATSGDAAPELARYAASVDLLMLGSHKYRPLEAWMSVQSTAQQLADSAPCPLLVLSSEA